ncbi:E2F transcription factor 3 [Asimina triloba]
MNAGGGLEGQRWLLQSGCAVDCVIPKSDFGIPSMNSYALGCYKHDDEVRLGGFCFNGVDLMRCADQQWLYVTEEDIKGLPCFQNETLIAIKAPHGTTLEVPDPDEAVEYPQRRYRIVLRSTMGPIDVYLVRTLPDPVRSGSLGLRQFEEKFEEVSGVEAPQSLSAASTSRSAQPQAMTIAAEDNNRKEMELNSHDAQRMSSELSASQDFVSGIMKIVPSDVDADSDYWLLSDDGVSITDMWKTGLALTMITAGMEWDGVDRLNSDFAMGDVGTPRAQTPPSGIIEVPPSTDSNQRSSLERNPCHPPLPFVELIKGYAANWVHELGCGVVPTRYLGFPTELFPS